MPKTTKNKPAGGKSGRLQGRASSGVKPASPAPMKKVELPPPQSAPLRKK